MNKIFLDGSSGNSLNSAGMDAFMYWNEKFPYNVNSYRNYGTEIDDELKKARVTFLEQLQLIDINPYVEWNSGATESIYSIIIGGFIRKDFEVIMMPEYSHPTAQKCAKYIENIGGEVVKLKTDDFGKICISSFEIELKKRANNRVLLYLEYCNGYTGALHQLDAIEAVKLKCPELLVSMDITQVLGKQKLSNLEFCDYVFGSCHKYGGMKGIGYLISVKPIKSIYSFDGSRDGTINHCGIIASSVALKSATNLDWRNMLTSRILEASFGSDFSILINESSNIVLGSFKGLETYVIRQQYPNVILGFGTACSDGLQEVPEIYKHILSTRDLKSVFRLSV